MWLRKVFYFSLVFLWLSQSTGNRTNMDSSRRPTFEKYQELRGNLASEHSKLAFGSDIQLSDHEEQFNHILMEYKSDELTRGFQNPFNFTPSRHFFEILKSVEASPLFKLIQKMPKGTHTLKLFEPLNNGTFL